MNQNATAPISLAGLSSAQLTARLSVLLGNERRILVEFLWCLSEMYRRRTYLELGYPSLFEYCTDALHLPKASAYRRTAAAKLLCRFPIAAEYLADGRLCLSTLVPLRDVITPENHRELLERASGRTQEDVEVLVATLAPRPEVKESLRRLPARQVTAIEAPLFGSAGAAPSAAPEASEAGAAEPVIANTIPVALPPAARPRIQPIDGERYSLKLQVSREFKEKLAEVKSALSHVVPDGDMATVLLECMERTLKACAKQKHAALSGEPARANAAAAPASPKEENSAYAPISSAAELNAVSAENSPPELAAPSAPVEKSAAAPPSGTTGPGAPPRRARAPVKRAVWARDEACCAFVGPDGKRCRSRDKLEFAHVRAFALGGEATVDNLQLMCRAHNQHAARLDFGEKHMARFSRAET